MNTQRNCPVCGKPLAANAPEGLCPECLMKAALGTGMDPGPDTQSNPKQSAFNPPAVSELAAKFPQLEILEFIGKGGMGAVYKARQRQLNRIVALKILPPQAATGAGFAERFAREARALAKLNHPHIVTLYEFGQADGLFYFLMEYVDGITLRQLLGSGRISPREALAIVPQICEALQFAHDEGIVHRDIKPENILLDKKGQVKIADFGVAKIVAEGLSEAAEDSPAASGELTAAGSTLGTPQYMAPEQIKNSAEVDHRADIYSLGVVFYQMLTGELPAGKIEPPSKKVAIDVRLDEVVLRALEKKPELRYQQASVFKTDVETIAETPRQQGQSPLAAAPYHPLEKAIIGFATLFFIGMFIMCFSLSLAFPRQATTPVILMGMCVFGGCVCGLRVAGLWPFPSSWFPEPNFSSRNLSRPNESASFRPIKRRVLRTAVRASVGVLLAIVAVTIHGVRQQTTPASTFSNGTTRANREPPVPVISTAAAHKGDINVYINAMGVVESSNVVNFAISEDCVEQVVRMFDAGQKLPVDAFDRHNKKFGHGTLIGVNNQIDVNTGTLTCKADLVPENGQLMIPGLFLNIRLLLEVRRDATLIPAAAVQRDAQSAYVWVVNPDRKVSRRTVKVGTTDAGIAELQDGLAPGEMIATDEFNNLQEGSEVRLQPQQNAKPEVDSVQTKIGESARLGANKDYAVERPSGQAWAATPDAKGRAILESQLKDAQAGLARVEEMAKVGVASEVDVEMARGNMEILRAEIAGGAFQVAKAKVASAQRMLKLQKTLYENDLIDFAKYEEAQREVTDAEAELLAAQTATRNTNAAIVLTNSQSRND